MEDRHLTELIQVMLAALLLLAVARVHGSSCDLTSTIAICNNHGIVKVPQNLLNTTTHLNLNQNAIKSIERRDLLRYRQVRQLFISSNQLRWVDEDAFLLLSELTVVDLSHNLITNISKHVFSQNTNLLSVKLNENNLYLDPTSPFLISLSIKTLDLTGCGIREISSETFRLMKKLKLLEISENNILRLDPDSFNQNALESLYVDPTEKIKPTLSALCRLGVRIYYSHNVTFCKDVHVKGVERTNMEGTTSFQEPEESTTQNNTTTNERNTTVLVSAVVVVTVALLVVVFVPLYSFKKLMSRLGATADADPSITNGPASLNAPSTESLLSGSSPSPFWRNTSLPFSDRPGDSLLTKKRSLP